MKQTFAILLLLRLHHQTDAFTFSRRAAAADLTLSQRSAISGGGANKHREFSLFSSSSVNGEVLTENRRIRDSEALFEADVTRVIQELRHSPIDPSVPVRPGKTSFFTLPVCSLIFSFPARAEVL